MVVLAASVVTKTGKVLVSRQFVEMTRIRIEGLLAAFPKLVGSGKQHTYIETEHVRYVYQPLDSLYLLLITNKQSNIVADLDTLRLLSKVVPEFAQPVEEETVTQHAFDLIFAFDEVISMGLKENITVQQVRQATAMDSHEEKLHQMVIQEKINETKAIMQRKAQDIDKTRVEKVKMQAGAYGGPPSSLNRPPQMQQSNSYGDMDAGPAFNRPIEAPSRTAPTRPARGGMQLGKKKQANDFMAALQAEGEAVEDATHSVSGNLDAAPPAAAKAAHGEPVQIDVEERLTVVLNKDGGLEKMELQGTMVLQVLDPSASTVRVELGSAANPGFQFKTHPNIDKGLYSRDNVLGLKDASRPFPAGSPLGVLKWRFQTMDEELLPLTINCWPSVSGNESYVNIEYESRVAYDLENVVISIPGHSTPKVNNVDGEWRYDAGAGLVRWEIDMVDDSNREGAMEFVLPGTDIEAFFPVEVAFTSPATLCQLDIDALVNTQTGEPVKYCMSKCMSTDLYEVV